MKHLKNFNIFESNLCEEDVEVLKDILLELKDKEGYNILIMPRGTSIILKVFRETLENPEFSWVDIESTFKSVFYFMDHEYEIGGIFIYYYDPNSEEFRSTPEYKSMYNRNIWESPLMDNFKTFIEDKKLTSIQFTYNKK
jgi:hypothetical protein